MISIPHYIRRGRLSFSVDLRGCCHWLRANVDICGFPRQVLRLMALPRQMRRLAQRRVPRLCPWQTPSHQPWQPTEVRGNYRGSFRGNCRGNFQAPSAVIATATRQSRRKSAAIATAASAHVQPQPFPRPSAAVHSQCHGNPPIVIHIV